MAQVIHHREAALRMLHEANFNFAEALKRQRWKQRYYQRTIGALRKERTDRTQVNGERQLLDQTERVIGELQRLRRLPGDTWMPMAIRVLKRDLVLKYTNAAEFSPRETISALLGVSRDTLFLNKKTLRPVKGRKLTEEQCDRILDMATRMVKGMVQSTEKDIAVATKYKVTKGVQVATQYHDQAQTLLSQLQAISYKPTSKRYVKLLELLNGKY